MEQPHDKSQFSPRDRLVTTSMLLGPAMVLTNLVVSYTLVPNACAHSSKQTLHLIAAASFVISLLSAFIARHFLSEANDHDGGARWERIHWQALVGVVMSLGSALVIVAMELPNILLRSCD